MTQQSNSRIAQRQAGFQSTVEEYSGFVGYDEVDKLDIVSGGFFAIAQDAFRYSGAPGHIKDYDIRYLKTLLGYLVYFSRVHWPRNIGINAGKKQLCASPWYWSRHANRVVRNPDWELSKENQHE